MLRVERETEWVVGTVGCNGIIIILIIIIITRRVKQNRMEYNTQRQDWESPPKKWNTQ